MLTQPAPSGDFACFRPNQFLARENETSDTLFWLQEGWACRYRLMADGRRHITALYLPGDYCEPLWALGRAPSQPVVALTNVRAIRISFPLDASATKDWGKSLWENFADQHERQANWLFTLGRKTALERLAHLFLELFDRMRRAGFAYGHQCALPLTQTDIADLTGLTSVHVNRTLQSMRKAGLIELQAKWLSILDFQSLSEVAALSPGETLA